jgi:hypothetical protein
MANFTTETFKTYDCYFTPKSAWEAVIKFIPKDKLIWECFYGNGDSARYLTELGCNVISEDIDFYEHNKGELIVSNPPFSDCKRVFARLAEMDKPFMLIVPISKITTDYFQKHFANKCQLIIPKKRIQFAKWDATEQKIVDTKSSVNFASVYVCYKMVLPSDLIFVD